MEQRIALTCGRASLESLLDDQPGERAVVVTHPHPLYGGDMHNNVVVAIAQAYRVAGFSTLRFNFRGVGASSGSYDGGIGEQDDIKAALTKLHHSGKSYIDLVGYSFGAWIVACGLSGYELAQRVVLVAPPVNMLDFGPVEQNRKIQLIIVGSDDTMADAETIQQQMGLWNPAASLHVVSNADHFFGNHTAALQTILGEFLGADIS
jgi:alpha/beta superfamily hydrolase